MGLQRWHWLVGLLVIMALTVAVCFRAPGPTRPDSEFTPLSLKEAPPELQRYYAESRTIPGLFVLQKEGQTYLLLMAGLAPEPRTVVEVIEVRKAGDDWRLLATLESGEAETEYPYAVVRLQAPLDAEFKARLTGPGGEVKELTGMRITDR